MLQFNHTLVDITSNARIKMYPQTDVLQVANAPIFRAAGFEPRKREYDVAAKGAAADPERSRQASRARAKAAIRDIALCNSFDYFFTWTLDKEVVDRYDPAAVGKKVQTFLKNATSRKGFSYICVPEFHQDGAIHFHGLCNLGDVAIAPAVSPYNGRHLSTERGQPIYNMTAWTLGYSTCIPIDENYERTCNYLMKYITKESEKVLGKWYLSSRSLIKKPGIVLVDCMDFAAFVADNPQASVVPVFNDVCIAITQYPHRQEGEVSK